MIQYILRRLLMLIPVLLGVSLLTFLIAQVTPGDPVMLAFGNSEKNQQVIEQVREQLGLNDPLHVQYARYVWNTMHGDLGKSIRGQRPVLDDILARVPNTLRLTAAAMLIAISGGVTAGVVAATAKNKLVDGGAMTLALIGLSIPNFWLAILFVIVFGVQLKWVSVTGSGEGFLDLFLPGLCLALAPMATLARLTRSSILEVQGRDYVTTARSKGLHERLVTVRHVLRNALIPVVTVIGLQFAGLLGGAVFIEAVFARPGLGRFALKAITLRDYPQIQGVVLFTATVYVLINLVIDLLYGWIDPRIRLVRRS